MEKRTASTNPPLPAVALGRLTEPDTTADRLVRDRTGRDRYLDLLRAVALTRIVAYHTFSGAAWLTLVFPSMGVMFALAGSLMARSLERPALGVLKGRARRLLLPLWVYSATVVPLMLLQGWSPEQQEGRSWADIVFWFIPLGDAPYPDTIGSEDGVFGNIWAHEAGVILWYIRAYFWFVLLSPLLLAAFRRVPWITLMAPLGLLVAIDAGWITLPTWAENGVSDFATYGSCWILGFAHYSGMLRRIPAWTVFSAGPVIMVLGLLWAAPQLADVGWDMNHVFGGNGLYAFGFCAMLLWISPSWTSLPRPVSFLDRPLTLMNNRAVTIYLWHTLLLSQCYTLVNKLWEIDLMGETIPWLLDSEWLIFAGAWLLLALVFVTVGWVEDVAAKRAPRLWPDR